jgi:hypothetical protein
LKKLGTWEDFHVTLVQGDGKQIKAHIPNISDNETKVATHNSS